MDNTSKPLIIVKTHQRALDKWITSISRQLPSFEVKPWNGIFNAIDVQYVVGWMPNVHWMNFFPNLKAVVSLGSGVDHIKNLEELREDVVVIRTVSPDLVQRMREYIALMVLSWHRKAHKIYQSNKNARWGKLYCETAQNITVGILGYGQMGAAAADTLNNLGYDVSIWANQKKELSNYHYFYGKEQLRQFVQSQDIIICLLPLTNKTKGILSADLFHEMKEGVCIINAGRGDHLNENDLIRFIENKKISYAILDVLSEEPLQSSSPLWSNEKVLITCHNASHVSPDTGSITIAKNINDFNMGLEIDFIYNRELGY